MAQVTQSNLVPAKTSEKNIKVSIDKKLKKIPRAPSPSRATKQIAHLTSRNLATKNADPKAMDVRSIESASGSYIKARQIDILKTKFTRIAILNAATRLNATPTINPALTT